METNFSFPRPLDSSRLSDACWALMVETYGPQSIDELISSAAHVACETEGSEFGPERMRIIAEIIWKHGFVAALNAQEWGAFSRINNN